MHLSTLSQLRKKERQVSSFLISNISIFKRNNSALYKNRSGSVNSPHWLKLLTALIEKTDLKKEAFTSGR